MEAIKHTPGKSDEHAVVNDYVKIAGACASMVGVGCSAGYYLAAVGFFVKRFKSDAFLLWMIIALYGPFPVAMMVQVKFDDKFDVAFGTRCTYFFRIVGIQAMMAVAFVAYALSSESQLGVLACGICIGSLSAAAVASAMQLMSAWDPHLPAWASVGKDFGGVLPVFTYYMLEFLATKANSSQFQRMQLFPICLLCTCMACGTAMHFMGLWDKAYSRLGYDLTTSLPNGAGDSQPYGSESDPLLQQDEVDSAGVPRWTSKWVVTQGINTFMTFLPMPLVTFIGDPDLTQQLVMAKLSMDCLSRLSAALAARTDFFGFERPSHYMLIAQETLRVVFLIVILSCIFGYTTMPINLFMFTWLLHYFEAGFIASQIDVTIVRHAPVAARKKISRQNMISNYAGLSLSLAMDVIVILTR